MYESFYGLWTKPFALLPDGESLYPGSTHCKAYSLLEYGLINEAPFMVLTGEPGMGKTSLLRKLIAGHHDTYSIGLVTYVRYDVEHLLPWVLLGLGLSHTRLEPVEAYHTFSEFINQESRRNLRVVLIVDEAQSLGVQQLEELRLLSNLNDGKTLKLQIILSGQSDLYRLLQQNEMTQFAQRIVVDHHLEPLNEDETSRYISHRLQKAGADQILFTNTACSLVHRLSKGIPRLINQICDISLTYGFAEQTGFITCKLVAQAALDRSRGGILPLGGTEELNALAASADDPDDIPVPGPPPQQNLQSLHGDAPAPASRVAQSAVSPDSLYRQGVALRKEGRFNEAIEAFRAALSDQSASRNEVLNVRYSLARTLESVGELEEASTLYQRIIRISPAFKDTAVRMNRLTVPPKPHKNGNRPSGTNGSWFSHVLDNLHQLIGSGR